jgi:hypothetical protein
LRFERVFLYDFHIGVVRSALISYDTGQGPGELTLLRGCFFSSSAFSASFAFWRYSLARALGLLRVCTAKRNNRTLPVGINTTLREQWPGVNHGFDDK